MDFKWPYDNEIGIREEVSGDVLVLGGGIAGCFSAIAAARAGKKVILVEKGAVKRSGAAGSGVDHWESACTNPCSGVTAEEIANAYIHEQDGYSNGIAHYIECFEGWHRLLDMESFGGKIRDTEGEFEGADFRDEKTGLMFAYDYQNKFTIRIWGSTFKPALYKELKRLGVTVFERTEATALLVHEKDGEKYIKGAIGMNVHTGKLMVFSAPAVVLSMSRPARIWLFDADTVGLSEFRPTQSIGSGHAMGFRAGLEFTMMEKSVKGEFSAAGRSFPPYSTGNNHNTWYAATMVDAKGREIPYVDRDGNELKTVKERYYPAKGQKFFLKGGVIDDPKYEYRGPETLPFDELIRRGYELPFYADLSRMPDPERRVIWGMMVGEEGKTKIPVLKEFTDRGFDPLKHRLQSYGTGWQSAAFLPQERQLFGAPGGVFHDWNLETNIKGLYAAGDQLYASDCCGFAAATGYYAGRKAASGADRYERVPVTEDEISREEKRLLAPLYVKDGMDWRELNKAIAKCMQNYCGGIKNESLLLQGLDLLESFEENQVPYLSAANPHELMRVHEVLDILDVCKLIINSCLLRKSSSRPLYFERSDYPETDPAEDDCFIVIRQERGKILSRRVPKDYYGDVKTGYEKNNGDYLKTIGIYTDPSGVLSENFTGRIGDGPKELKEAGLKDALSSDLRQKETVLFTAREISCSVRPITFDAEKCVGCNRCAAVCQVDVLVPAMEKGCHPIVMYPGECYYCGSCVMECGNDAIRLRHPLMNRTKFTAVTGPGNEEAPV